MADQGSQGLLSSFLRYHRIRASLPYLRGRILDMGCSLGKLADHVHPSKYTGYDPDREMIRQARLRHPEHRFLEEVPCHSERFDTVAALAVIEHLPDPEGFLNGLARYLPETDDGLIVFTTPNPAFDALYRMGAAVGLFSREACEQHESLLNRSGLFTLAERCNLRVVIYKRFLLGANQLIVFQE